MQKIQWKRHLATLLAFLLLVSDAPMAYVQAEESSIQSGVSQASVSGPSVSDSTVSDSDIGTELVLDTLYELEIETAGEVKQFVFTPEKTGWYSLIINCDKNFEVEMFDFQYDYKGVSRGSLISRGGTPATYRKKLVGGETYCYEIQMYDDGETGDFTLYLCYTEEVVDTRIVQWPYSDVFAYPVEQPTNNGLKIKLILSDGQTVEVVDGDENWIKYALFRSEIGTNGYRYEKGEYEWWILVNDSEEEIYIPFSIVSLEEAAKYQLTLDKSISSLEANMDEEGNGAATWVELSVEEKGFYQIYTSNNADIKIYDADGNFYSDLGSQQDKCFDFTLQKAGKYYLQVACQQDISMSLQTIPKPTVSAVTNIATGVQVKWGKVTGATGYEVYRKTGNESYTKIATITSGSTVTYTDKTAANNTTYTYAVKAVKGNAVSNLSNVKSITFLKAPAISAISGKCAQVKLTWGKVTGATGYEVYRKTGSGSYSKIATITSGSTISYTDKTAKVGTSYTYTVLTVKSTTKSAYQTTAKSVTVKDHSYENVVTKATTKKNGSVKKTCETCGKVASTKIINKIKTVTLANTEYTYNGKTIKPKVTVKDSKGNTISSKYYTVTYKNNKNVGRATVTITFKGNYSGKVTKTFTIKPKGTKISNLMASSKGFSVKWNKQKTQVTGYEIQYSTNKNFTSSTTKTVQVGKNTTVSQKVKGLKGNKKYFVRIRTYKTVKIDGKSTKIYSDWSAVKTIRTKK